MKRSKSGAVWIFLGAMLTVFFVIGLLYNRNPGALLRGPGYDVGREQFAAFCGAIFLPCGIVGIPMLLISLILSLIRERREK